MAEKKFIDLHGIRVTCDDSEEVLSFLPRTFDPKKNECKIVNHGDHLYVLDENNGYSPIEVVLLESEVRYNGEMYIKYCYLNDLEKIDGYMPFQYNFDDKTHNSKYSEFVHKCKVMRNNTHSGLCCTSLKVAQKLQKKILDGKCFCTAKTGDTLYCLHKDVIFPIKVKGVGYADYCGTVYDCIICDKLTFRITSAKYETFTSSTVDKRFYITNDGGKYYEKDIRIYVSQKDAERAKKESNARKAKTATDKYLKKLENYDGKNISHKDSFGNDLHYGDKVAFSIGTGGVPYVSIGRIIGETKTKITLTDERNEKDVHAAPEATIRTQLAEVKKENTQVYQYKTFAKK